MLHFNDIRERFLLNCVEVRKKAYQISLMRPSQPQNVFNVLEGARYVTGPDDVVCRGTVGEFWVQKLEKAMKTYRRLDGGDLRKRDFVPDHWIPVMTKPGNYCFAMHIPSACMVAVDTAWGSQLIANRPGVPHGAGDYIVCAKKDGKPDLNDVWVVNGLVFNTTYEFKR